MVNITHTELLRKKGLKDTIPRRMVLDILVSSRKPLSPAQIRKKLGTSNRALGIVTVYRVLKSLEKVALIHRHPHDGLFSFCQLADIPGHHILLHCHDCGAVQEIHDTKISRREEKLARKKGFFTSQHVSEIRGTCDSCS